MDQYNLVYLGPHDRVPTFGGAFWFDKDVRQPIRADLAAQLLYTRSNGVQQFQVENSESFAAMQAAGYLPPDADPDVFVWVGGSRAVAPAVEPEAVPEAALAVAPADQAIAQPADGDVDATADGAADEPEASDQPATAPRRRRGAQAQ